MSARLRAKDAKLDCWATQKAHWRSTFFGLRGCIRTPHLIIGVGLGARVCCVHAAAVGRRGVYTPFSGHIDRSAQKLIYI